MKNLKSLRKNKEITQAHLGKMLGVTREAVNAWEAGISFPTVKHIKKLMEIFEVSSDYLLDFPTDSAVNTKGLNDEDIKCVHLLIETLKNKNKEGEGRV